MPGTDHDTTVQQLKDEAQQFREERGWVKHNTPRNLAASIVVEAAELLEHFQWQDYRPEERQEIIDELADILNYCLALANTLDADVTTAFRGKLERVRQKYPVELFNPDTKNLKEYKRIKKSYRQKGTA